MSATNLIPAERIERRILLLRGQKVMLDFQLAELYEVPTKVLNQAVKRNIQRFPEDFMFQLSVEEAELVAEAQIVTLKSENDSGPLGKNRILRSQIVTSKSGSGSGGRRYQPFAFTEQGVAMLSSVLRSPRAVQANITIMRTFAQLRQLMTTHAELAQKLRSLESKYDKNFKVVFDAIRELMSARKLRSREIGFHTAMPKPGRRGGALAKGA